MLQLATSSHSLEKRDYVIRELVDTECNYVDVLSKIIKYFLRPLTPYLKPQDLQVIFFGIKVRNASYSIFVTYVQFLYCTVYIGMGNKQAVDFIIYCTHGFYMRL